MPGTALGFRTLREIKRRWPSINLRHVDGAVEGHVWEAGRRREVGRLSSVRNDLTHLQVHAMELRKAFDRQSSGSATAIGRAAWRLGVDARKAVAGIEQTLAEAISSLPQGRKASDHTGLIADLADIVEAAELRVDYRHNGALVQLVGIVLSSLGERDANAREIVRLGLAKRGNSEPK